jgi:hypothetical protein
VGFWPYSKKSANPQGLAGYKILLHIFRSVSIEEKSFITLTAGCQEK